jgi:RimJ/RimL family protein N-acetyltransferase
LPRRPRVLGEAGPDQSGRGDLGGGKRAALVPADGSVVARRHDLSRQSPRISAAVNLDRQLSGDSAAWHRAAAAIITAVNTADVRLEPLGAEHLDDTRALFADPGVLRFTRVPDPPPEGFTERWYERYEESRRTGEAEGFAAVDGDGAFLGLGLAPEIDVDGRQLELGYIVAPAARGRGVGRAILTRLTDWAFDELAALRAYLLIEVENRASARIAAHCGYTLEGVMRSYHLKQQIRIDAGLWSRLPSDRA